MADKPPLPHEEVQRILRQLEPLIAERRVVLVGGQAVSFWVRLLQPRSEQLALAEPLTSKDIDFEGGAQAVRRAADLLEGRMKLPTTDDNTPNTGLVLFTDADGIEREIDFIDAPLGLNHRDVRDTAVQLMLPDENGEPSMPMLVMHPERCMESRIVNAIELRKTHRLRFASWRCRSSARACGRRSSSTAKTCQRTSGSARCCGSTSASSASVWTTGAFVRSYSISA